MKNLYKVLLVTLLVVTFFSCYQKSNSIPSNNEVVMHEGMSISVNNNYGEMRVTAGIGSLRHYTWKGETRSAKLYPRKERWNGSLGLYYPGENNHWRKHDGISRAVLEEGQQHFSSIDDAINWINKKGHWGYIFRDDGLVVGWAKLSGAGGTLTVSVWQIFINGKKPKMLPGSQNDKIVVNQ